VRPPVGGYGECRTLVVDLSEKMDGAEARRKSPRKESSKVVKIDGSWTFSALVVSDLSLSFCAGALSVSQVHCSSAEVVRAFFD
jgi:hypothetical protein